MTNPTEKRGVCETNINEIKEIFCQIDLIKRDPRFFIYDHFSVLKNKVDLRREIISAEGDPDYDLEKTYINLIEQVEEAEKTCEENLSSFEVISTSLVDEEKALKQRLEILTESLDSLSLDSVFHEALKLKKNAENFFEVCKDEIFIFKKYDFLSGELYQDFGLFSHIPKVNYSLLVVTFDFPNIFFFIYSSTIYMIRRFCQTN